MENIKITSGKFRGQNIKSPNSKLTHPMGSREKLALFNMISEYLPGANVLDAYAGSGALGIEALSREANHVVFVERNPRVAKIIRENIESLGLADSSLVLNSDVEKMSFEKEFDVIIADPPYDNFKPNEIINLTKFLKNDGCFVLSHPKETLDIEGLELIKTKKYAGARISIYKPDID